MRDDEVRGFAWLPRFSPPANAKKTNKVSWLDFYLDFKKQVALVYLFTTSHLDIPTSNSKQIKIMPSAIQEEPKVSFPIVS